MNDVTANPQPLAPETVELDVDGAHYAIFLPQAATDYIQGKIATERVPYERDMLEDMRSRLKPGDLVLDVGANIGNHTLYLAAATGCRVDAFEANASLCEALRRSVALNRFEDRIRVHSVGVGSAPGTASFAEEKPDNLGAQKLALGGGEIEVVALDSLPWDQPVRMLKVDVEGMEMDVLRGARALVARDRPVLYVECISEKDLRQVTRWVEDLGYSYWDTFNATPTHLFVPAESVNVDRRLARLHLMAYREEARSIQIASSVRQKLTRAYDNEREAKQQNAQLTVQLADARAKIQQVTSDKEAADARVKALEAELAKARKEHSAAVAALETELGRGREAQAALARDLDAARQAQAALAKDLDAARMDLDRAGEEQARTRDELTRACDELTRARDEHSARLEAEQSAATAERARLTARSVQLEQALRQLEEERRNAARSLELSSARLQTAEQRLERVRTTTSYLVGTALIGETRSVSDALSLPQRLWRIYRTRDDRLAARQAMGTVRPIPAAAPARSPATAKSSAPATPELPPAPAPSLAPALVPAETRPASSALPAARRIRPVASLAELKIACIFDEFTYESFAPDCQLLQLRSDTWKQQLTDFKPDLLFIESAWRGAGDTWQKKVSDIGPELLELLEWAGSHNIPSAFWCKEDPVHFVRFLPVARLVDHVFTTDIDCIPRYMAELQHERVHLLPFAAQPALHNPVETFPREDAFCFAGSYYRKYPERQADFQELVMVGRKLRSVVIYDRNSRRPQPHDFNYPEEYRSELREALDYAEVDRAYKGFRFGLTVNTIKQSQTMFARRAFELMACNTVVVSNFSRGLRQFFGDVVVASDDTHELEQRLGPVCAEDSRYRALRLIGLRTVLRQHTYAQRLAYVISRVSGRKVEAPRARVCLIAEPASAEEARRIDSAARAQEWEGATLLLVGDAAQGVPDQEGIRRVTTRAEIAPALRDFDHVAVLHGDDHYGPHYVGDLALATIFFGGDGITKGTFYRARAGQPALVNEGSQYKPAAAATLRRSLLKTDAFLRVLAGAGPRLAETELTSGSFLSVDEFSYCESAFTGTAWFDAAKVEAAAPGRPPVDYAATIQLTAEAIRIPEQRRGEVKPHLQLSGDEIARELPRQTDVKVKVTRNAQGRLVIESSLPPDQHSYLYLRRRFAPGDLMSASEMRFELDAQADEAAPLNLCTVFVFRDAAEQKLSLLTDKAGETHALRTPKGTDHVRLALRVQGPGRATVGGLRVTPALHEPIQAIPNGDHLVVTRGYPGYDDLYRYTFVHSRVRAYARAGEPAQVLCLGTSSDARFREFQGVDVTEADAATLDHFLAQGACRNVLVHFADAGIWEVVSRHLDHVRVTIWVHGADIQPWWRRVFGEPDASNDWARRTNDERQALWHEILRLRHPNLTLVFISLKQLREAMGDLRVLPAELGRVEVIHNFIDTERFRYQPKPAELRKRVLSIRPYSSAVYGNDLAVAAIQRLAREPFFAEMHFRLVGDGKLFDETVAPLRDLPNVEITKGFLTQEQIAQLHREYGIFLVPSRMDTQGVSRDEAMSSGLVPVTNRVAAIPEFVDHSCGFLADPEDAEGLADAIRTLYRDPARFQSMSEAAARRVRGQSGYDRTVARELALLGDRRGAGSAIPAFLEQEEAAQVHVAIYGDVNLNIVDGSAVWAASLAETLASGGGVRVTMLLKARIKRTVVLSRLLDLPSVQLVEPSIRDNEVLGPAQAVAEMTALMDQYALRAVVLRGLQVCDEATRQPALRGKLWAYLTDIPQREEEMDADTRERIARIIVHSEYVLCQTPQMQAYLERLFPQAAGRTRILSPMIPPPAPRNAASAAPAHPFRLVYAGKFAPRWGIEDLFRAFDQLRAQLPDAQLHVYGDKIHQSTPQQPRFREDVQERLRAGNGLHWHGAVDRAELMRALSGMHACWAFRDPAFERDCLELSTKALEYAALQVPVVLARSAVNESVFGPGYPLFAESADDATQLLVRLATDPALREQASRALAQAADRFAFPAVRASLQASGLLPAMVEQQGATS